MRGELTFYKRDKFLSDGLRLLRHSHNDSFESMNGIDFEIDLE